MTINFLSYLDPFKYHGGGEQALRRVIERGRQRGHQIRVFARRTGRLSKLLGPSVDMPPADLYFLADLFNCPEDGCALDPALLERIVSQERYIHFNNAYVDVCRRPAMPCGGDRRLCQDECGARRGRWLYQRSMANIFVSPLHLRVVSGLLGEGGVPNPVIARPFIDVDLFYNRHQLRDIEYLSVGVISDYKGYQNVKQRFAGKNIVLIGRNLTAETLIGSHIPYVRHEDLPLYYNRAKYLVHLPEWPEPQGRCVVEGALCGCDLITNDRVGATTFDFDIRDAKIVADAPDQLWREIEKRVGVSARVGYERGMLAALAAAKNTKRGIQAGTNSPGLKINFITYLDPFRYDGGGERTSRLAIEAGRRRGHQIEVVARRTGPWSKFFPPPFHAMAGADLYILSDIFNCPEEGLSLDLPQIARIVERERYIHWDHAYVDVCGKPALPCEGHLNLCNGGCPMDRARWLHAGALANIFGSPLHYTTVKNMLGDAAVPNPILWRPMIDTRLFYNRHQRRDIDYLYVGVISRYKGYENLKQRFADEDIVLIGPNLTGEKLIGRYWGLLPYKELPLYYNRATHFVHLPEWPEPQGRSVVEAALCGCKLITNERVGAGTCEFDISDPQLIADAPDQFWRDVERCCDVSLAEAPGAKSATSGGRLGKGAVSLHAL